MLHVFRYSHSLRLYTFEFNRFNFGTDVTLSAPLLNKFKILALSTAQVTAQSTAGGDHRYVITASRTCKHIAEGPEAHSTL